MFDIVGTWRALEALIFGFVDIASWEIVGLDADGIGVRDELLGAFSR